MSARKPTDSLDIAALQSGYAAGAFTPAEVLGDVYRRIEATNREGVWIHLVPEQEAMAKLALHAGSSDFEKPLRGIPFAIKDNIDAAGLPTTAACPDFKYQAEETAFVVARLEQAGAILIGKTNLDQFATGLVGTRSPYGVCRNAFDDRYISGGSSSGSAVAVAAGLVSFSLGTDTAGSGRVPAGFQNIIGLKPTRGVVSTHGVVPACRSLDCVSIFALTCDDAARVFAVCAAANAEDPFQTRAVPAVHAGLPIAPCYGVPRASELEYYGDEEARTAFERAQKRLDALGWKRKEIEFSLFTETATLLYEGPWLAERTAAMASFLAEKPEAVHPVTRGIVEGGKKFSAVDAFEGQYRLQELKRRARNVLDTIDMLVVPTSPTVYTLAELEADPLEPNRRLGYYTNFANLLDFCAVAVPNGLRGDGLPTGITLLAPAGSDSLLLEAASQFHQSLGGTLGATGVPLPAPPTDPIRREADGELFRVAVAGLHLSRQPLNGQLTELGGVLSRACLTSPSYKMYAVRVGERHFPGLVRQAEGGASIPVEIWDLPIRNAGRFLARVKAPLGIGSLELADGAWVNGFICEPHVIDGAMDITSFGGWLAYLAAQGT